MITNEMIFQAKANMHRLVLTKWLNQDVFSVRWWSLIALIIVSYIICFSLLDKRRASTLFLFGALICVGEAVAEDVGINFLLWSCQVPVLPIIPCLFVPYLTVIPAFYMLIYQYTKSWKQFSLWNLIAASIIALVLQPIFIYFGIYHVHGYWRTVYNIPIIFFITSLARATTIFLVKTDERYRRISK